MLHTKPIRSLEAVEMGVAEFENTLAEYDRAGGIRATDQEMKDDLLHILPAELRDALVWNSRDGGSFHAFRDMVTTQAAKVLMNRHKLLIHHVASEDHKETAGGLAAELLEAYNSASSQEELVAAFQRIRGGKGGGKGFTNQGMAFATPDGKSICFKFNNQSEKCKAGNKCKYLHVCGVCFKKHPAYECTEGAAN